MAGGDDFAHSGQIAGGVSGPVEIRERDAGLEEPPCAVQGLEPFAGGHDRVVGVALAEASILVGVLDGEHAGPVEVEGPRQHVAREAVDERREAPRDVGVAEPLADDAGVLALGQGVVVGMPGAGLGELGVQLGEQRGDRRAPMATRVGRVLSSTVRLRR